MLFRATFRLLQLLGIIVTMIGVIIAAAPGDLQHIINLEFQLSDVLMIIACVVYPGNSLILCRCPKVDPLALVLGEMDQARGYLIGPLCK